MSAFVVSDKCMDTVLSGLLGYQLAEIAGETLTDKGRRLFRMNVDAVMQRYQEVDLSDREATISARYRFTADSSGDIENFSKAVESFLYQCREGNVPTTWPEYEVLSAVAALNRLAKAKRSMLPGG